MPRAFKVREDALIPSGLPRNDELRHITPEKVSELKKKIGLPLDKKVILYAPTWRDSVNGGASYDIKPPIDMDYLEKELSDEYVFLMRTHQYTNNLIGVTFNDFCRDYCSYPSINDLLIVSDIMISDYSTCIRDYSILERPIICFAYDYEDYVSTRGIYIDFQTELPSGVVRTQQDVVKYIKNMNYTKECEKTRDMIKAKFEQYGGSATEMCVNKLFET